MADSASGNIGKECNSYVLSVLIDPDYCEEARVFLESRGLTEVVPGASMPSDNIGRKLQHFGSKKVRQMKAQMWMEICVSPLGSKQPQPVEGPGMNDRNLKWIV